MFDKQMASIFSTDPSNPRSDRYAMEMYKAVTAENKALLGTEADKYSQVYAAKSRIEASEAADQTRRSQLLANALADGSATEYDPKDPTRNMVLAYVYNIDQHIDKVASLTSMGQLTKARAEREKIDSIVKDNFNLIYGMTNEEFSRLGPAGEQLQINATKLTKSNVWTGVKVNIHGQETSVYDALDEGSASFKNRWATEIRKSSGAAAGELILSDDLFPTLMEKLPKGTSPEFISRITKTDANGSSVYGTAKGVFGEDLVYLTPQILDMCKQTGDAADVLDSLNLIGASFPTDTDRGTKALSAYKSLRNFIMPSENGAEGGYVEGMKFNAALRAVVKKFNEGKKSIDLTNPAFQTSFRKAQDIVKRCEAWGLLYHASGTSNGWSPNESIASYVYDELDGLPQDPKNHLASYGTLDHGVSTGITGPSPQNPSYATLAQNQESNLLTHTVQKVVFQTVGKQISSKSQTPDQAFSSILEPQDPNTNGGSYNTGEAQNLETNLDEELRKLGLHHSEARVIFAEAMVNALRSGGGRMNIETVGNDLIAVLTSPENVNPKSREAANAISSFLYTYYTPEGKAMTTQIEEDLAARFPMYSPAVVKWASRFMSANIREQTLMGANGAQELQRLNNMFPGTNDEGKLVIYNIRDATASTPEERLSRTHDNAMTLASRNSTAYALAQAQLIAAAKAEGTAAGKAKGESSDSVGNIKAAIGGGNP